MEKTKKVIIWTLTLLIIALLFVYVIVGILQDNSRLTPQESEWVNGNLNKVHNVSVLNDTNLFGTDGKGLFYDFLADFTKKYGLRINSITYNSNEVANGIRFLVSNTTNNQDINFYEDHYILVSKSNDILIQLEDLKTKKIGVLSDSVSYLTDKLGIVPTFVSYPNREELMKALDGNTDIQGILVPRIEYMDQILSSHYFIVSHFTNIPRYYNLVLDYENNEVLSNILKKYFTKWLDEEFEAKFHSEEFQMFVKYLNISQTEMDKLQSVVYNYGFINNSPYEVLTGGDYGGILAAYLKEFSDFCQIDFNFKRFKNYKKLVSAIDDNEVDLYFGYQNFTSQGTDILSDILVSYDVLAHETDDMVVRSLNSLYGKTVYVESNSLLFSRFNGNDKINVETYDGEKGLRDVIKKRGIIIMDHHISSYYQKNMLNQYSVRYTETLKENYVFKTNASDTFNQLFSAYLDYLDENRMTYLGIYNHSVTVRNGTILGTIAKYLLYIMVVVFLGFYILYRSSKRVRVAKKIRKEDKMKFIDQLTSLKNRNYLNENISRWNKNTIYPQTMVVIDLNRIQEINDTLGYEQGDAQIRAAANVLIKTQLDNSDVMRTDGNEFMIYFIGYQTKQITAYIHKLNKEFKKLPYEYGACIGYSMIVDDIKSIEDAINEATLDVKKQKEMQKEDTRS
ncbi:MAG: GGDEF domain-containing protein [Bacilli bacterium]|nr:GGDEF domain-containing protein [Bacilli bacterium]